MTSPSIPLLLVQPRISSSAGGTMLFRSRALLSCLLLCLCLCFGGGGILLTHSHAARSSHDHAHSRADRSHHTHAAASSAISTGTPAATATAADELEVDFIVVGGGSTGSIVAARLAQSDAGFSVLLLEAGGATQARLGGTEVRRAWEPLLEDERQREAASKQKHHAHGASESSSLPLPTVFDIPLEWHTVLSSPSLTRRYAWAMPDSPQAPIARGLGGCAIHNAMVYVRGLDGDFDLPNSHGFDDGNDSRNMHQNKTAAWPREWSFRENLPFYQRTVSQRDPLLASLPQHAPSPVFDAAPPSGRHHGSGVAATRGRGRGGEVYLSSLHPDDVDPFSRRILEAWSNPDLFAPSATNSSSTTASSVPWLPLLKDMNDPSRREGVGLYQFLIRDGRRDTASQELYGVPVQEEQLREEHARGHERGEQRRGTLHVRTNVQATRILFDEKEEDGKPRATGVEVVMFHPNSYAAPTSAETEGSGTSGEENGVPPGASPSPPHSRPIRLRARREVIISAGAINTPALLLRSGIGPAGSSGAMPMRKKLRGVGANLLDGAKALMQFRARGKRGLFRPCMFEEPSSSASANATSGKARRQQEHDAHRCARERRKWMEGQVAAFASSSAATSSSHHGGASAMTTPPSPIPYGAFGTPGFAVGAFLRSDQSKLLPDIQLTIFPFDVARRDWSAFKDHEQQKRDSKTDENDSEEDETDEEDDGEGIVSVEIILNHPRSRGDVTLREQPHPDDDESTRIARALLPPRVHLAAFEDESDVSTMLRAFELVRKLMSSPALGGLVGEELLPGAELDEAALRDFARCGPKQFRRNGIECESQQRVVGHLAGTARMGPWRNSHHGSEIEEEDDGSVVDPSLRVHGVRSLRVADASVIPVLPSGNTHATCMLVGERLAHFLLEEHAGEAAAEHSTKHPSSRGFRGSGHSRVSSWKHQHQRAAEPFSIRDLQCPAALVDDCRIPPLEVQQGNDDEAKQTSLVEPSQPQSGTPAVDAHSTHQLAQRVDRAVHSHKKVVDASTGVSASTSAEQSSATTVQEEDQPSASSSEDVPVTGSRRSGIETGRLPPPDELEKPTVRSASGGVLLMLGVLMMIMMLCLLRHVSRQHGQDEAAGERRPLLDDKRALRAQRTA